VNQRWNQLATDLVALLDLDVPPVAMCFVASGVDGVEAFADPMTEPTSDGRSGRVPASCVFWMKATDATFSTVAADHGNCSVGRWVHGFASPEDIIGNDDVGALLGSGWVTQGDVGGIRVIADPSPMIVYGPLRDVPIDPDVVLVRLTPRQMMELGDACHEIDLSGKPQCQIVSMAKEQGTVAVSMGCALSRERTGMPDDELTSAIPAAELPGIVERLRDVRRADGEVRAFAAAEIARTHP
jgi:uncharacterized protein (DUF169 family)